MATVSHLLLQTNRRVYEANSDLVAPDSIIISHCPNPDDNFDAIPDPEPSGAGPNRHRCGPHMAGYDEGPGTLHCPRRSVNGWDPAGVPQDWKEQCEKKEEGMCEW